MSIVLNVKVEDPEVEKLLRFLDTLDLQAHEKVDLLNRTTHWIVQSDVYAYSVPLNHYRSARIQLQVETPEPTEDFGKTPA